MHQLVHQEGGADHVAGRFQQEDEEEQDQDLRQEDDDRADAADHAVDDQRAKHAFGKRCSSTACPSSAMPLSIQPTGTSLHANTAWNITNKIGGKDQRAGDRMEQHAVEPVRPAPDRAFADDRRLGDLARAALQVDEVGRDALGARRKRGADSMSSSAA